MTVLRLQHYFPLFSPYLLAGLRIGVNTYKMGQPSGSDMLLSFIWGGMSIGIWCANVAFSQKRLIATAGRLGGSYTQRTFERIFVFFGILILLALCLMTCDSKLVTPAFLATAVIVTLLAAYFHIGWYFYRNAILVADIEQKKADHNEYLRESPQL